MAYGVESEAVDTTIRLREVAAGLGSRVLRAQ